VTEPAEPAVPTEPPAVPIRDAASVLLLRDGPDGVGPQLWMLTRVSQMVFAAGASVFPGGRVDDADATLPWSGRPAEVFAAELGYPVELARALVGAAVRETFEETGVLLTTPPAALAHLQPDVEAGRLSFGDLLREHGLAIDADALRPWAHWVTPPGGPRRYSTRFFVAALPAGAEPADLTSESTTAAWTTAADAIAAADRGEIDLMLPTRANLASITAHPSVAEILAGADGRSLAPVQVVVTRDDDGTVWLTLPDGTRMLAPRQER
jgi:8-oxo-dGTP pyrophosphatase MutT (NUDIX family)